MKTPPALKPQLHQHVVHPSKKSARENFGKVAEQISLLTQRLILSIVPVPAGVALCARYYIQVQQGLESWTFPLQFTQVEAKAIAAAINRDGYNLSLELSPNGVLVPSDWKAIAALVERAIDGGATHA